MRLLLCFLFLLAGCVSQKSVQRAKQQSASHHSDNLYQSTDSSSSHNRQVTQDSVYTRITERTYYTGDSIRGQAIFLKEVVKENGGHSKKITLKDSVYKKNISDNKQESSSTQKKDELDFQRETTYSPPGWVWIVCLVVLILIAIQVKSKVSGLCDR